MYDNEFTQSHSEYNATPPELFPVCDEWNRSERKVLSAPPKRRRARGLSKLMLTAATALVGTVALLSLSSPLSPEANLPVLQDPVAVSSESLPGTHSPWYIEPSLEDIANIMPAGLFSDRWVIGKQWGDSWTAEDIAYRSQFVNSQLEIIFEAEFFVFLEDKIYAPMSAERVHEYFPDAPLFYSAIIIDENGKPLEPVDFGLGDGGYGYSNDYFYDKNTGKLYQCMVAVDNNSTTGYLYPRIDDNLEPIDITIVKSLPTPTVVYVGVLGDKTESDSTQRYEMTYDGLGIFCDDTLTTTEVYYAISPLSVNYLCSGSWDADQIYFSASKALDSGYIVIDYTGEDQYGLTFDELSIYALTPSLECGPICAARIDDKWGFLKFPDRLFAPAK